MKDLTGGSIARHILIIAAPIAVTMLTQIAYQLIDLYFVTRIGVAATAGVNAAGNVVWFVAALMQVLGVGAMALVAHAAGRKDQADANLVFNQSIVLAAVCGAMAMVLLYMFIRPYLRVVAADVATIEAGATFVSWVLPGYALMLPMTVLSFALRAVGIVRPTIVLQMLGVTLNAILAPILIAGWGTGTALGVKGAGLATSISIGIVTLLLAVYFHRFQRYMIFKPKLMRPQLNQWNRVLVIGLPAGCEVALVFLSGAVVYYVIRDLGSSAQAGFGVGSRIMQIMLLPGLAVALAAGPIVGQNFGAKNGQRVKEAFRTASIIGTAIMITTTILVQWQSQALVDKFGADTSTIAAATLFLKLMSWTFVAQSMIYTCSNIFQGLGNAVPPVISSGTCLILFSTASVWLSVQPNFHIEQVWYLLVASITLHATVSLWLLRLEFRKRLLPITTSAAVGNVPPSACSTNNSSSHGRILESTISSLSSAASSFTIDGSRCATRATDDASAAHRVAGGREPLAEGAAVRTLGG